MEIEGKIIAVMPAQGGVSARTGNSWKSQDYVIETHEQFPKKCVFRVFGEDKIANMNIQIGEELRVSFDIDAHEYNGRWFNDVRAWKVDRIDPAAAQAALRVHNLSQLLIPPLLLLLPLLHHSRRHSLPLKVAQMICLSKTCNTFI